MMANWIILFLIAWLAATISGSAGFGGALILLPILTNIVGVKVAVPILTVAQLLGNASRAWFGWREIRIKPVMLFILLGLFLGLAMIIGSWTGKKLIQKLPREIFLLLVEVLMAISGLQLIFFNQ